MVEDLKNYCTGCCSGWCLNYFTFLFCSASNFPDKISVYSTLVGLLNVKDYKCGEEVCILSLFLGIVEGIAKSKMCLTCFDTIF
jgi:hypothetical protein